MSGGFEFLEDWLFLFCTAAYLLNRFWLKQAIDSAFLRNWFSDLLLAPCAVPVVLWLFRRFNLRPGSAPPCFREMAWILATWSLLFEWIGPHIVPGTVGDWRDALMYWLGGFAAWFIWTGRRALAGRRVVA